ncbi:hypothetical protein, partial [Klebsiella pneumoniae]|uniref:hypothetical protein n=1 Tax=Klebsiella pneumoniae TaxID=573 RepID=UPI003B5B1EC4
VIITPAKAKPEKREFTIPKLSPNKAACLMDNSSIGQEKYTRIAKYDPMTIATIVKESIMDVFIFT